MFIEGALLGGEGRGEETLEQLSVLLAPGETALFATAGDNGGALFTDERLLVTSNAGLFTKRSIISSIKRAEIGAFRIDVDGFTQVTLRGASFGEAYLFFDLDFDKIKLARWLAGAADRDEMPES